MKYHTKLGKTERDLLAQWKVGGCSNSECARRLGRHKSTIGRELKRNQYHGRSAKFYEPLAAQGKAEKRKAHAWKVKQPLKSKKVFNYVMDKLKSGWSPEQISGRLKYIEYPKDPDCHICAETIYTNLLE